MKTKREPISKQEQALLKKVAGQIMGWTFREERITQTDQAGTHCFFVGHTLFQGTTYAHSDLYIKHGCKKFGISEKEWNPLTDPVAYTEVIDKLIEGGCQVTLMLNREGAYCLIQEGNTMIAENAQAPTAGQAICYAAVRFSKTISDLEDQIGDEYEISARPREARMLHKTVSDALLEDQAGDDYQEPEYTDHLVGLDSSPL